LTRVKCNHCNYSWDTNSTKIYVTCSSCMLKINIENCTIEELNPAKMVTELIKNAFDSYSYRGKLHV